MVTQTVKVTASLIHSMMITPNIDFAGKLGGKNNNRTSKHKDKSRHQTFTFIIISLLDIVIFLLCGLVSSLHNFAEVWI